MAAINQSNVFSMVSMPSPEFLRKDRFEPVANGSIYIGKTDSDPTNPANQIPVYAYQEDGSLVQVSQPLKINDAGYPVYNGKATKFITQSAASMRVLDQDGAEMWYWPNLFEYDPAQMWNVLASSIGAAFIGTEIPGGNIQDQLKGYVTPWNFIGKPNYATEHAAIQAMFDYAKANNKLVWAVGATLHTNGILTAEGIKIVGGEWNLAGNDPRFKDCDIQSAKFVQRSPWANNTTFRNCEFLRSRVRHDSGDVRVLNSYFSGEVGGNVAHIVMQGSQAGQTDPTGTIEVDGCVFKDGLGGIFQQGGHAKMRRAVFRNLTFINMKSDAIELNVVNDGNYDDGCVIENILIADIDHQTSVKDNLGIGIGIAGKGPYAWDAPESNYARNVQVRNVTVYGVRQCIHFEVASDFSIENVNVNPDANKSTGAGIITAGIYIAGSKDFVINGVEGDPVGSPSVPQSEIRMVCLVPGPTDRTDQQYNTTCRNYTVRNVRAPTAWVQCWAEAYPGYGDQVAHDNNVTIDNVEAYRLSVFGVANELNLSNIKLRVADFLGDTSTGGGHNDQAGSGTLLFIRGRSVLNMFNVNSYDDHGYPNGVYSKCRYSEINRIGCNIEADQYVNFTGSLGQLIGTVPRIYYTIPAWPNYQRLFAKAFPTGREFCEGDMVIARKDSQTGSGSSIAYVPGNEAFIYLVTKAGAWIPNSDDFALQATTVGSKTVKGLKVPQGGGVNAELLNHSQLSPGCRITIPGAGLNGGDLRTWIARPPYQDPPSDPGAEIQIDIAHPIQTATAAGVRMKATYPIEVYPDPSGNVN